MATGTGQPKRSGRGSTEGQPQETEWNQQSTTTSVSGMSDEGQGGSTAVRRKSDGQDLDRGLGDELRQLVRDRTYEQLGSQKDRATSNLGTLAGGFGA
jgi:hypothetical protein